MKSLLIKDINQRIYLKKIELELLWCKSNFINNYFFEDSKEKFVNKWFLISKNQYFSKLKMRCNYSNRSRGIYSELGISRIKLKNFASYGFINGIKKASW